MLVPIELSHKSKLNLLRKAKEFGFKTYLYYIFTDTVELNIERIRIRVLSGGHDVPEEKIRSRFFQSLKLLKPAIELSDRVFIIDNSFNNFELCGEKISGVFLWRENEPPLVVNKYF